MNVMKVFVERLFESCGVHIGGNQPGDIRVHDERFYRRIFLERSMGAGESYMDGWWDCDALDVFFAKVLSADIESRLPAAKWIQRSSDALHRLVNHQTAQRSVEVADRHYNIGNDLYTYMLGPSMAYTCAYYRNAETLDEAQFAKYDLVCRKVDLKPGDRVLDLGCGFGGFAKYAAEKYGCSVVGVNIARQQVEFARSACKGLPIEFFLGDYRDVKGYARDSQRFDKVVSIGLCEHIGYRNYRAFLALVRSVMKEDGLFLLHTIGNWQTKYFSDPWMDKYIFPNGMSPSLKLLTTALEGLFVVEDLHNFGADYDRTVMAWLRNFKDNWERLAGAYDQRFFRMWSYYLCAGAGAFRVRDQQLWQLVLTPRGMRGGYQSVR
jgi:cyclopropane-fatty-acyl-phospholipid synthase